MLGVCFVSPRNDEWRDQWDYVLSHWQPDRVWVVGQLWKSNSLLNAGIVDTIDELPDIAPKYITAPDIGRYIQGETSLAQFEHPDDCIYIFGPDDNYLRPDEIDMTRIAGTIHISVPGNPDMYSFVSAAVVLYDRALKLG